MFHLNFLIRLIKFINAFFGSYLVDPGLAFDPLSCRLNILIKYSFGSLLNPSILPIKDPAMHAFVSVSPPCDTINFIKVL